MINPVQAEQWIPCVGFERRYEVSSHGRVRSLHPRHRGAEFLLSIIVCSSGYHRVHLSSDECRNRIYLVHRLVMMTFSGPPPVGRGDVNHINGVKSDNRIENLEWTNDSLNMIHAYHVLGTTKHVIAKMNRAVARRHAAR